ncbi:MAG: acylphosphatase [Actinobacteria bacterium]|nr:acylphosphatase [Actinomycetota bacterium]
MKRVHVHVSGRVQGVFFRAACADEARRRGLTGFVRNMPDGRVEAAFQGPDEDVDALVEWCRRGTDWSRVDEVEAREQPPRDDRAFEVRH